MQVSFRTIQLTDGKKRVNGALRARAAVRPALRQGSAFLLGLAGGWAVLYGALMPFGLGLTLGFAEDCFAVGAAGAALGVLARSFGTLTVESVCLLCALGAAVAARWLWPGRFVPAVAAGCGTLVGSAVCFAAGEENGVQTILFCGGDALLAAAMGYGLRRFPPEKPGMGSLISTETGESITYGLYNAQERGTLFIGAGVPVYEGMIIGVANRGEDIVVNACRKKQLTNTRASGSDDALRLVPPRQMSLEQCLEFLADDELLEVTPKSLRMRKAILNHEQRMKSLKGKK